MEEYLDLRSDAKRLTPMLLQAFSFGGIYYTEGDIALRPIYSKIYMLTVCPNG